MKVTGGNGEQVGQTQCERGGLFHMVVLKELGSGPPLAFRLIRRGAWLPRSLAAFVFRRRYK